MPTATPQRPTVVDLFAGAGGLSEGFSRAGYTVIGAVEHWAVAAQSLQANHPQATVETRDIRTVDANEFLAALPQRPNLVLGGPSCQGFSTSGGLSRNGRRLDDDRNSLFLEFIRFVHVLQPEWVLMENVPGLLLFNRGAVAREVVKQFRIIGYHVVPIILLAADFGVPQLRRRLFFVGNRTQRHVPFPLPTHGNPDLWKGFALPFEHLSRIGNKSTSTRAKPHVTFADACSDLPQIAPGDEQSPIDYLCAPQSHFQRQMRGRRNRLTLHVADAPSAFELSAMRVLRPGENWTALPSHLRIGRFAKIRSYDATTLLRRLQQDRPVYTINTKFNDATTGAYIHPVENRTLSLREAARLQAFPDAHVFLGSPNQIRKQIGNAVPPLLAQQIAAAIAPSIIEDSGIRTSELRRLRSKSTSTVSIDPTRDIDELLGLKQSGRRRRSNAHQLSLPFSSSRELPPD